jgi:hypothetical protein
MVDAGLAAGSAFLERQQYPEWLRRSGFSEFAAVVAYFMQRSCLPCQRREQRLGPSHGARIQTFKEGFLAALR